MQTVVTNKCSGGIVSVPEVFLGKKRKLEQCFGNLQHKAIPTTATQDQKDKIVNRQPS